MVLSSTCQHCRIIPMPLNTGDRRSVVSKCCHSFTAASKVPKIPNLHQTIVTTRHNERIVGVPVDNIDIRGVRCLREHTSFAGVSPHIPDFQCFVNRARHKHICLIGTPSDIFNTGGVGCIRLLTDGPGSTGARSPDMDSTCTVACGKGSRGDRTPVHSEAFCLVPSKGLEGGAVVSNNLLLLARQVKSLKEGGKIEDGHGATLSLLCPPWFTGSLPSQCTQ